VRNLGFKGFHINLSRLSGYSVKASPWTRYIKPDFACYEEDIAPYKGNLNSGISGINPSGWMRSGSSFPSSPMKRNTGISIRRCERGTGQSQRSESGGRKTEDGRQRTEGRGRRSEVMVRILERRNNMPAAAKQKDSRIKAKQFVTDTTGHKMAAVIDMEELNRLETILDLIPASETWLYKNKKVLESVQRGLGSIYAVRFKRRFNRN
jgi:hypothetical protein